MKKGWEVKTLGDVCKVERGSSPRPIKKYLTTGDGVNWIKIGDTKNTKKYIFETNEKITKEGALKSRFVDIGDFILSNSMSLGRPYIMKTQGYIHDGWFVLRLNKNINDDYFYYLLISPNIQNQFHSLSAGAIVKNISSDLVKKIVLPIPPLTEQQRIVKILDAAFVKIDTIKQNAERNLQNAKELLQSLVDKELSLKKGWDLYKLSQICLLITDGTHSTPKYTDNGVPFLSVKNLTKGFVDFSDTRFISEEEHLSLTKRCKPEKNDILYTKVGTTGIAKVIDTEREFSIFVSVALLKIKHEIIYNYYLEHALNSPNAKKQAKKRTRGTANKNLVITDIKEITVPVPPIAEQHQIVTKLDTLSEKCKELENNYRQTITDCDEMKKSILAKAFNGEL